MVAVGMCVGGFGGWGLGSGGMCVQRAHAIGTTGHSVDLPSGGPEGRPEEKNGKEAHAGAEPGSRSDGMERISHWPNLLMLAQDREAYCNLSVNAPVAAKAHRQECLCHGLL